MSVTPQKHPRLKRYLAHEWRRFNEMSWQTLCLLLLTSIVAFLISPLVPLVAYALQLWASTWAWRDRWASMRVFARQGSIFAGILCLVAFLDLAHIWIIPDLVAGAQGIWRAHLPGELSLMPVLPMSMFARTILFLPLAPVCAMGYEYINPQSNPRLRRVLTASDLAENTPASNHTPTPGPTTVAPEKRADPPPTPATASAVLSPEQKQPQAAGQKQKQKQPSSLHRKKPSETHQMTIDSFLSEDVQEKPADLPAKPEAPPRPKSEPKPAAKPEAPRAPAQKPPIDWKNIDE